MRGRRNPGNNRKANSQICQVPSASAAPLWPAWGGQKEHFTVGHPGRECAIRTRDLRNVDTAQETRPHAAGLLKDEVKEQVKPICGGRNQTRSSWLRG